jgi:tetratricopeptide (TPR) repeat protein
MAGYSGKGVVYMFMDEADSAYKYFLKVYEFEPNNGWVNLALAQLNFNNRNDIIKAMPHYWKAYEMLGKTEPGLNSEIGLAYADIGYYSRAEALNRQAMNIREECMFMRDILGLYFIQGKYDQMNYFLDSICGITTCEELCTWTRFYSYTFYGILKMPEIITKCLIKRVIR